MKLYKIVLVTTSVVTIEQHRQADAERKAEQLRRDMMLQAHHGEKVVVAAVIELPEAR